MGTAIGDRVDSGIFKRPWTYSNWLAAAAIAGLLVVLYGAVVVDMVRAWSEEPGASHGFLIPPMALWIAWMRRQITLRQPAAPDNRGLWLTTFACLCFLMGRMGAEFFVTRLSLLILLAGLAWTFWGLPRLRTLLFPLLLLTTMIPLPAILYNWLAVPLQLFASSVATRLAQSLGVTVYRDGNIINLAHISLGVAEACSGLHSLSALMVASLLVGFLYCSRLAPRILLFAASIPIAIVVNVMRVTGTAVLADYRQELAMGFYHSFSGWLIFLLGFGLVVGLAKALHALLDRGAAQ